MREELDRLLEAAKRFVQEHDNVEDNPKKLLESRNKGAAECTRVSNECGRLMKIHGEAEDALRDAAMRFLEKRHSGEYKVFYDLSRERWPDVELAFAAVRFVIGAFEFSVSPTAHKSHGPHGSEIDRFFKYREELVTMVHKR